MLPGLGINMADREILQKNVNIVFHVAATVRFDEKLRLALQVNVSATREIILLAREIPNLKVRIRIILFGCFPTRNLLSLSRIKGGVGTRY